ncbi:MAG: PP2C family protein-serine/threonine phosphatase [Hyphomicrobiaceae bacterium]
MSATAPAVRANAGEEPMLRFEAAWRETKGARPYQEDSAAIWPGSALFLPANEYAEPDRLVVVLADGMGGHIGGALASRTACESFLTAFAHSNAAIVERLKQALAEANRAIARKVADNPKLSGMGSTLVGASFGPAGMEWISIGDSPLYLYRYGEIAPLNEDHSLAPALDRLALEGKMTAAEAKNHPYRHMLRAAVTGEELDLVDFSRRPLAFEPGDCVVLASDGILTLDAAEIARVISASQAEGVEAVAAALIRAVENARDPYQDNATVIVVRPLAV